MRSFNDFGQQNAAFLSMQSFLFTNRFLAIQAYFLLAQRGFRNFYVGGRFLSACEMTYFDQIRQNILEPWRNLNDEMYVFRQF